MHKRGRRTAILLSSLVALSFFASACGGGSRITTTSAEAAYLRGAELVQRGRYDRAIEQLRAVFDFGRAHEFAADAQLLLADAYFEDGQYLLAANEYDRFVQLYRGDTRVGDAEYKRALSYYRLSPSYQLDQKDTQQAITYLRLFISRFPTHERVAEAGVMIVELQEKLAQKLFAAAELYERQGQYESAALTFQRVLDEFPNTSWAPRGMLGTIRSYLEFARNSVPQRQPERLDKAIQTYERLIQIFPGDPVIQQAEPLYQQARVLRRALDEGMLSQSSQNLG
jgi:outer membrane protein assembly factor BamD